MNKNVFMKYAVGKKCIARECSYKMRRRLDKNIQPENTEYHESDLSLYSKSCDSML